MLSAKNNRIESLLPLMTEALKVLENIKTAPGARTLAIDPRSHHIFMPTADFSAAAVAGKRPQRIPKTFRVLEIGK